MTVPPFISQYPGVMWLMFSLPQIIAPAFLAYISISSSLGLTVGWESLDGIRWIIAVTSALTYPIAFFCSITWNRLRISYRARSLGATTPPVIAGKLPGSLDIVWQSAKSRFTAYPGESRARRQLRRYRRLSTAAQSLAVGLFLLWTPKLTRRPAFGGGQATVSTNG